MRAGLGFEFWHPGREKTGTPWGLGFFFHSVINLPSRLAEGARPGVWYLEMQVMRCRTHLQGSTWVTGFPLLTAPLRLSFSPFTYIF